MENHAHALFARDAILVYMYTYVEPHLLPALESDGRPSQKEVYSAGPGTAWDCSEQALAFQDCEVSGVVCACVWVLESKTISASSKIQS